MAGTKRPRLMVINEPDGRRFSRALALEIGRDHAEVFLQMEYLISISNTPMIDGRLWTAQSVANLQDEHFPYWGKTFIAGILADLTNGYTHLRYVYSGFGRTRKRTAEKVQIPPLLDRAYHNSQGTTTWYALDEQGIATLQSVQLDTAGLAAVSATRQPVTGKRKPVSAEKKPIATIEKPVAPHAGDFITETPTETPTEGGRGANDAAPRTTAAGGSENHKTPEPPPNFRPDETDLLPVDQGSFEDSNIVAIRTNSKVNPNVASLLNRRHIRKGGK